MLHLIFNKCAVVCHAFEVWIHPCFFFLSKKTFVMYFALGLMVCQFIHVNKPHFYLACHLACLDESLREL